MNEEKALLHFNKFKALKNQVVVDSMTGFPYVVVKARKVKKGYDDYSVVVQVKSQFTDKVQDFDSEYANINFKEVRNP